MGRHNVQTSRITIFRGMLNRIAAIFRARGKTQLGLGKLEVSFGPTAATPLPKVKFTTGSRQVHFYYCFFNL